MNLLSLNMESITVEILNPKAKKLLQDLADLNLIAISKIKSSNNQEWLDLSEEHRSGILKAIDEIETGKGITHEEVLAKYSNG